MVFAQIIDKNLSIVFGALPNQFDIAITSTDSFGTPGRLNKYVLEKLGYDLNSAKLPDENTLRSGYSLVQVNELKPVVYVVTVGDLGTDFLLKNNLTAALLQNSKQLTNKRIWLPLMGTGSGGLSLQQSYDITISVINNITSSLKANFTISIPENEEGKLLLESLLETPNKQVTKGNTISDYIKSFKGSFYVAGSMWGREDQAPRFFENSIWETGHEEKFQDVINNVAKHDIIFLKSAFPKNSISYLRIKAIGIVTENELDGTSFYVDWKIKNINVDIEHFGYLRKAIEKVNSTEALDILSNVQKQVANVIDLVSTDSNNSVTQNNIERLITSPGLLSDSDKGNDYFDISKDVNAFAKLIAAKSFQPPLAIALFGQWGSGKSFFMGKLRQRIEELPKSNNIDYCEGIAHIHFNAWSFMDANLWASIVSRIFEGLHQYISSDSKAKEFKREIDKEITKQLNSTQEALTNLEKQKESVEEQIKKLNTKKNKITHLIQENIKKIRNSSIKDIIEKANAEFNIKTKIEDALSKNKSYIQTTEELQKIVPEEYWGNPDVLYSQVKSKVVFIKEFFRPGKFRQNLIWLAIFAVIIFGAPFAIKAISEVLPNINFALSEGAIYYLSIAGAIIARVSATYKRLQPLFASFWMIKEEYNKKIEIAKFEYEQEEKALKIQIEQSKNEIAAINLQIQNSIVLQAGLKFKIENALSTEALYSFIQKRGSSDDYQKHLGIVSTIRKDFEILSDLFDEHKTELVNAKDKKAFLSKFDKPLERIVLYIDDLDRCPEERVVEVLEAVNLLMAYPLFIVIVGVDQRWIKNSLKRKYSFQFDGKDHTSISGELDLIDTSNYLEKIFQVPFHLKQASDSSIKNMITQLGNHKPTKVTLPNIFTDDFLTESEFPATITTEVDKKQASELTEHEINTKTITSSKSEVSEDLMLTENEINKLQAFSKLIGNNPRAIKRFVNIYRIVKTHEELSNEHKNDETELTAIMFLLALSIGPLKENYKLLIETFQRISNNTPFANTMKLFEITDKPATDTKIRDVKDLLNEYILNDVDGAIIKNTPINSLSKYTPFINRFSFKSI